MTSTGRITTVTEYGDNAIVLNNSSLDFWTIRKLANNTYVICGFVADRLAAYEDTGLTPDEIVTLIANNKQLHELVNIIEGTIKAL